jgi:hypothetical protein
MLRPRRYCCCKPAPPLLLTCARVCAVLVGCSNAVQAQDQEKYNSVFMAMMGLPGTSALLDPCCFG